MSRSVLDHTSILQDLSKLQYGYYGVLSSIPPPVRAYMDTQPIYPHSKLGPRPTSRSPNSPSPIKHRCEALPPLHNPSTGASMIPSAPATSRRSSQYPYARQPLCFSLTLIPACQCFRSFGWLSLPHIPEC